MLNFEVKLAVKYLQDKIKAYIAEANKTIFKKDW